MASINVILIIRKETSFSNVFIYLQTLTRLSLEGQCTSLCMLMRDWCVCSVYGKQLTCSTSRLTASRTSWQLTTRSARPCSSPWHTEPDRALVQWEEESQVIFGIFWVKMNDTQLQNIPHDILLIFLSSFSIIQLNYKLVNQQANFLANEQDNCIFRQTS